MKKIITSGLFQDDVFQLGTIINVMMNIGIWILLWRRVSPLPDPITLQYNIYFGTSYIGEWYKIYVIPIIGLFIFLLNYILSYSLYRKDKIAAYFLLVSAAIIHGMLLFAAQLITTYT